MRFITLGAATVLLLALGCARPETAAAPPQAAPPTSGAWYSPRNWFRHFDSDALARKPANYEARTDTSDELRAKQMAE
jgi:hypothetical protein